MSNHELFNTVRLQLLDNGFERAKKHGGGHFKFRKGALTITVPHKLHDRGMARTILKQAGI